MPDLITQILIPLTILTLSILLTYLITKYFLRGRLAYVIFPFLKFAPSSASFIDKININYKGNIIDKIDNVSSIRIKFKNIGSKPVYGKDIREDKILVSFPEDVEIITWADFGSSKRMRPVINYIENAKNEIGIKVDYLDKNEFLIVDILCRGSDIKEPNVIAEVAGADIKRYKGIPEEEAKERIRSGILTLFSMGGIGILFLGILFADVLNNPEAYPSYIDYLGPMLSGCVFLGLGIVLYLRSRRYKIMLEK